MLLRNKLGSLKDILSEFETILQIDHTQRTLSDVIERSIQSIGNKYRVSIDQDTFNDNSLNEFFQTSLDAFLGSVLSCIKNVTMLTAITCFDGKKGLTVQDVNYLGFRPEELKVAIAYLQDSQLYEARKNIIPALIRNVNNMKLDDMKRLFTVMFVLERLKIKEGVAAIAQYIYLGV